MNPSAQQVLIEAKQEEPTPQPSISEDELRARVNKAKLESRALLSDDVALPSAAASSSSYAQPTSPLPNQEDDDYDPEYEARELERLRREFGDDVVTGSSGDMKVSYE